MAPQKRIKNADILLTASEINSHDLEKLKLEFPVLCYIYQPVFIGDLDSDGKTEILIDRSHIREDFTEILVFQQEGVESVR